MTDARVAAHRRVTVLGRARAVAPQDQPGAPPPPFPSLFLFPFPAEPEPHAYARAQILTGSADGSIHVLYSPATAIKGVTLAVTRAPKARQVDDFASASMLTGELGSVDRPIIAPHSLPMFKDDVGAGTSAGGRGGKRKRERERHDPQKTMKPSACPFSLCGGVVAVSLLTHALWTALAVPPVQGPGKGGRIGAAATQHVVQGLVRNTIRDQDVRPLSLSLTLLCLWLGTDRAAVCPPPP